MAGKWRLWSVAPHESSTVWRSRPECLKVLLDEIRRGLLSLRVVAPRENCSSDVACHLRIDHVSPSVVVGPASGRASRRGGARPVAGVDLGRAHDAGSLGRWSARPRTRPRADHAWTGAHDADTPGCAAPWSPCRTRTTTWTPRPRDRGGDPAARGGPSATVTCSVDDARPSRVSFVKETRDGLDQYRWWS
ncbi:MAG: hypothetical protein JWP95_2151 [Actinotalea sp.]|nr:hypothetical protein [Actinotalea sp.]